MASSSGLPRLAPPAAVPRPPPRTGPPRPADPADRLLGRFGCASGASPPAEEPDSSSPSVSSSASSSSCSSSSSASPRLPPISRLCGLVLYISKQLASLSCGSARKPLISSVLSALVSHSASLAAWAPPSPTGQCASATRESGTCCIKRPRLDAVRHTDMWRRTTLTCSTASLLTKTNLLPATSLLPAAGMSGTITQPRQEEPNPLCLSSRRHVTSFPNRYPTAPLSDTLAQSPAASDR